MEPIYVFFNYEEISDLDRYPIIDEDERSLPPKERVEKRINAFYKRISRFVVKHNIDKCTLLKIENNLAYFELRKSMTFIDSTGAEQCFLHVLENKEPGVAPPDLPEMIKIGERMERLRQENEILRQQTEQIKVSLASAESTQNIRADIIKEANKVIGSNASKIMAFAQKNLPILKSKVLQDFRIEFANMLNTLQAVIK